MRKPVKPLFLIVALVFSHLAATAQEKQSQSPRSKPTAPTASPAKPTEEINPVAEQRKLVAIELLTTLADEARSYHDQTLRSRVLARAADALWETDQEKARALFRRSWEAATVGENEAIRRYQERLKSASRSEANRLPHPPELRAEVLRIVAKRDTELSEEFFADLKAETDRNTPANAGVNRTSADPSKPPMEIVGRLQLARTLLRSGETGRALLFADKALDFVTTHGIFFLCALREVDQTAADQRFARMLANTVADPTSDATAVSVLSTYVFTPFLYIIVRPSGISSSQERQQIVAPNISPELRLSFLRSAALILLRPVPPPEQDFTVAGRRGLYFLIARLLPLFDQHAPNLAPELRVQLASLGTDVPESLRAGRDPSLTRGLVPASEVRDDSHDAEERAARAGTSEERDGLYGRAAMAAAFKGETAARDFVDKISDSDLRKRTRAYIDYILVKRAIDRKDPSAAVQLLASAEITNTQRTWSLQEIAELLRKTDGARAVEVLDEAAVVARRIGTSDPDRARVLLGVATRMFEIDRGRVWDAVAEAVKAANSAAEFNGEDGKIDGMLEMRSGTSISSSTVDSFNVTGLFGSLAVEDLFRAVELARGFNHEAPRASATLAIARAVLIPVKKS